MSVLGDLLTPSSVAGPLLLDGPMGTELIARGLPQGTGPELWNLEAPEAVIDVHASYLGVGSRVLVTNSFGGTGPRLALLGLDDRVREINRLAAELARRAVDGGRDETGQPAQALVAGSMGPTGESLAPLGPMSAEACRRAFAEQAEGLSQGGADVLWIETMGAMEEVELAVDGARSSSDLPIAVTLNFDGSSRTLSGVTGTGAAERLGRLDLAALGVNCGENLAGSEAALAEIIACNPNLAAISKCNAGLPDRSDGTARYHVGPEEMAAHARRLDEAGVRLIGACCGAGPDHIAQMAAALSCRADEHQR